MMKKGTWTDEQVFFDSLLLDYVHVMEATRRILLRIPKEGQGLPKVGWDQVVNMAEKFAAEATSVGIVWHGDVSDMKPLADNMEEYFGLLQRVIMLGYGATRDAGITLAACMLESVDDLQDVAMNLMKEAVNSYGRPKERNSDTIPKMIGLIWDAWIALGKIPTCNATAVGEALSLVAISAKEKIRKLEELKEASSDEAKDKVSADAGSSIEQKKEGDAGKDTNELKEGSCDQPETIKDEVSDDAGSGTKELKKGLSDPTEEVKDEVSSDAGSSIEQKKEGDAGKDKTELKESSRDQPETIKDEVSDDAGSGTKELKKGSSDPTEEVKDEVSADAGSSIEQKKEGDAGKDTTELKESSCDQPETIKDEVSDDVGSGTKELKKGSSDPTEEVKDEVSCDVGNDAKELKKDSSVPSDKVELSSEEKTIARLTTGAVSEILELMNQHGPEVIHKERKGAAAAFFVDSLGTILKKALKEVLKEAPFAPAVGASEEFPSVPSEEIQDMPSDAAESSSKEQEEDAKDKPCDVAESSSKELEKDAKDKPSDAAESSSKELEKDAKDKPSDAQSSSKEQEKDVKDKPSDAAESSSKELEKDAKDKPSDAESSSKEQEKDAKDKPSDAAESSSKELEKDAKDKPSDAQSSSKEQEKDAKDKPSDAAESSSKEQVFEFKAKPSFRRKVVIKIRVSQLSPEDQMSIIKLANDALSGLSELLDQLGPAVLSLVDREKEGTVEDFVEAVESVLKMSKDIESSIEGFVDPEYLVSRRIAFTKISRILQEMAVVMHQLKGGHYSVEFSSAWKNCIQIMRQLASEYQKHNPTLAQDIQQR